MDQWIQLRCQIREQEVSLRQLERDTGKHCTKSVTTAKHRRCWDRECQIFEPMQLSLFDL